MCALQKFNANVVSEPKHKKKKPIPTSTDESESKIAFVKKKAKRAKVFLKEKLTDHSNSTDGSKPYRQNDVRQIAFILIITQVGRILNLFLPEMMKNSSVFLLILGSLSSNI